MAIMSKTIKSRARKTSPLYEACNKQREKAIRAERGTNVMMIGGNDLFLDKNWLLKVTIMIYLSNINETNRI